MRSKFSSDEERRARERWYLLKDPLKASKVLGHDRYWSLPFLRRYVDNIDALNYDDPIRSTTLADPLGKLAERIPIDPDNPLVYQSEDERRSWIVYAWCVRGTSNLLASRFRDAEYSFDTARAIARTGVIDAEALGELYRRFGLYQMTQQDEAAASNLTKAIEVLQDSRADDDLTENLALAFAGRALVYQTVLGRPRRSYEDYAQALALIGGSRTDRARRTALISVHNIGCLMAAETDQDTLRRAVQTLLVTRKAIRGGGMKPIRAKLLWAEAMILARFGISVHAARQLTKARNLFLDELDDPFNAAIADVDLLHLHLHHCEYDESQEVFRHLNQLLSLHPEITDQIPVRWKRMPTLEEVSEVVRQIRGEQCVPPGDVAS